jgi:hypothetical protein
MAPQSDSHFLCLTREGAKELFDREVFEHLCSEDVVPVRYERGKAWAEPVLTAGPLAQRLDAHLLRRIARQQQELAAEQELHWEGHPRAS